MQSEEMLIADPGFRFKFHQYIHITLGSKIIPQYGAKQGQLTNVVTLAEGSDFLGWDINVRLP